MNKSTLPPKKKNENRSVCNERIIYWLLTYDLCPLQECLATEIKSERNIYLYTCLGGSPGQTHVQVEIFTKISTFFYPISLI